MKTLLIALATAAAMATVPLAVSQISMAAQHGQNMPPASGMRGNMPGPGPMPGMTGGGPGMGPGMGPTAPGQGMAPGMGMGPGMMPMMMEMMHGGGGMGAMPGMGGMPRGDEGPSSLAYQGANNKMHRDMAITYSGDADVDFAKSMIPHHQGAIDTAKIVLAFGSDPEIRKLAEEIIKAQEAEIATLKGWLEKKGQ